MRRDGTTSTVLLIGELMKQAERHLGEGCHPRLIADVRLFVPSSHSAVVVTILSNAALFASQIGRQQFILATPADAALHKLPQARCRKLSLSSAQDVWHSAQVAEFTSCAEAERKAALICMQGFDAARVATVAFLETFRQNVDAGDREMMLMVARTSLRTKLAEGLADQLTAIVADAVLIIQKPDEPIDLYVVRLTDGRRRPLGS